VIGIEDLTVRLGGRTVLHGISFAAWPGELCALCGPNGAGKTTLLRALAGLIPPRAPEPRRVAYVEQGARAAWKLTVEEVVRLGRLPHGDQARGDRAHDDMVRGPVERAMALCGISDLKDRRVDQVSGGQARRAMLARALATEADVLLLDEPTSDLDPRAAHEVMALLARQAQAGRAVVAVLHQLDLALCHAGRMVVLREGRIAADAAPRDALPEAAAAFGLPWGVDPAPRLLPPEGARGEEWRYV
jgi:iron complex transport system ATP-binding protein